jgi:4-amino-4-deoxy-L-arabinose transferase-like glycosyltransferase
MRTSRVDEHSLPVGRAHGRASTRVLLLIVTCYLVLGTAYALRTPAWQAPDEPAHYNYIAQVAGAGCCPVIEPGDWDQAYLDQLKAERFAPPLLDRLASVQYEDHQPPLYYLLAAPLFTLTGGSLVALRLFSALIGVGVIVAAFSVARWIAPARPAFGLLAASIAAFVPQHLAVLASVNNDALSFALMGAAYAALAVYARRGLPAWLPGLIAGLGLLIKLNTLLLLGLFPLIFMLHAALIDRRAGWPGRALRQIGLFLIPAAALGALWWLRNLTVYGPPDLFGLGAHDRVVVGQLRTVDFIAQVGLSEYVRALFTTTFNSFWGQFGWMAAPLPEIVYHGIGLLLLGAAGAGLGRALAGRRQWGADPPGALIWGALALAVLASLAQYGYYNLTFVQFQGRYLFVALIPLALMFAWGWEGLARWAAERIGFGRWPGLLILAAPPLALIALNGWIIWRVLPGLAP